jgi:selenium-binding protein 1
MKMLFLPLPLSLLRAGITAAAFGGVCFDSTPAFADETCSSPYLARIEGQEEFLYVWTLGVEGLGDDSDKLVVVDVKPGSSIYGKVIHQFVYRIEKLHAQFRRPRRRPCCDEELWRFDGHVGFSHPKAPPGILRPRCAARDSLGLG